MRWLCDVWNRIERVPSLIHPQWLIAFSPDPTIKAEIDNSAGCEPSDVDAEVPAIR
jgi:hypothetical protein